MTQTIGQGWLGKKPRAWWKVMSAYTTGFMTNVTWADCQQTRVSSVPNARNRDYFFTLYTYGLYTATCRKNSTTVQWKKQLNSTDSTVDSANLLIGYLSMNILGTFCFALTMTALICLAHLGLYPLSLLVSHFHNPKSTLFQV